MVKRFLFALVLAAGVCAAQALDAQQKATLSSLIDAERAFARLSGKFGQAPAFLAYFADDVATFGPVPATGKEALRQRAAAAPNPPVARLDWEPWFADISGAGDLGYTTGPASVTELATGKLVFTGWYFSIWKRDENGWRVAADIGVSAPLPGALRPGPLEQPSAAAAQPPPPVRGREEEVRAAERDLAERLRTAGHAEAYQPCLAPAARFYRNGVGPLAGADAVRAFLSSKAAPAGLQLLHAATAASGDFAYTFGLYDVAPSGSGASPAKSSFLHVWKRTPGGWLLAVEVVN